jgi:conjugal transfer/type IV secretion protein DotA/TraY
MLNIKRAVSWFTFLVFVSAPQLAFAGLMDPPDGDKSKTLIVDKLFGPLSGGGADPLGSAVGVLNAAVLLIGGILAAYSIVAGMMSTAHDGQMLGKKWSSLWVPIRTAVGAAAVLPTFGHYCLAQKIVIWLALGGVGIADHMWSSFSESTMSTQTMTNFQAPDNAIGIRQALADMLVLESCQAGLNANNSVDSAMRLVPALNVSSLNSVLTLDYGEGLDLTKCGRIELPQIEDKKNAVGQPSFDEATDSIFSVQRFNAPFGVLNKAWLLAAHDMLAKVAQKIVDNPESVTKIQVVTLITTYAKLWSQALQKEAQSSYASAVDAKYQQKLTADGWLMAGAWYMQIARAQDAVSQAASTVPTGTTLNLKPNVDGDGSWLQHCVLFCNRSAQDAMTKTLVLIQGLGGSSSFQSTADSSSYGSRIFASFIESAPNTSFSANTSAYLHQNPVMMVKNMGAMMITWGWGSYLIGASLASIATGFAMGVTAMSGTLIISGATLAAYVPMLPFLLWMGVILAWAILLIEAVIAAPLWAIVHLAPDADGIVGRGGQGYMLVLSLTLRPCLAVLGLAAAISLMGPIGFLLNSFFISAFFSGVGAGSTGLTVAVAGCVIYTVTMISIINRVFALIHIVPDRILRWIGGGGSNEMGQEAQHIEGATGQKLAAGMAAGAAMSGAMSNAMIQSQKKKKDEKDAQDQLSKDKSEKADLEKGSQDSQHRQQLGRDQASQTAAENNATLKGIDASSNPDDKLKATEAAQASQTAAHSQAGTAESTGQVNSDSKTATGAIPTGEAAQDSALAQEIKQARRAGPESMNSLINSSAEKFGNKNPDGSYSPKPNTTPAQQLMVAAANTLQKSAAQFESAAKIPESKKSGVDSTDTGSTDTGGTTPGSANSSTPEAAISSLPPPAQAAISQAMDASRRAPSGSGEHKWNGRFNEAASKGVAALSNFIQDSARFHQKSLDSGKKSELGNSVIAAAAALQAAPPKSDE